MKFKSKLLVLLLVSSFLVVGCSNQNKTVQCQNRIRFEHVAINVPDPVGMAQWYCQNLDMKIKLELEPPNNTRFVCDAQENMMLELYSRPDMPVPNYNSISPKSLHVAFMVDDVEAICKRLQAAGATLVSEPSIIATGDEICMLRDPWGVPIQFLKRKNVMLEHTR